MAVPTTKIVAQYHTRPMESVAPTIPATDPLKIESVVNVFELIRALCATDSPFTNRYFSSFSSSDFLAADASSSKSLRLRFECALLLVACRAEDMSRFADDSVGFQSFVWGKIKERQREGNTQNKKDIYTRGNDVGNNGEEDVMNGNLPLSLSVRVERETLNKLKRILFEEKKRKKFL